MRIQLLSSIIIVGLAAEINRYQTTCPAIICKHPIFLPQQWIPNEILMVIPEPAARSAVRGY
jgi:hypothetical protein